jgi:hypothetical protein
MGFDFIQFDPEAPDFYLGVNPAEKFDIPVRQPPG